MQTLPGYLSDLRVVPLHVEVKKNRVPRYYYRTKWNGDGDCQEWNFGGQRSRVIGKSILWNKVMYYIGE